MQDDILEPAMTPLEILLFTAKLKIHESADIIENKVSKMLDDLNLNNCKNTRIGDNNNRGVSGGERKRTSIAVELISDPKILFLDEPTTGLDSFNAYEVIENICELAKIEGKIVIFTIHQPSSEIYSLLDKILILADGKTTYFGEVQKCLPFFDQNLKLSYPGNYNPFEYFIEMTTFDVINNSKIKRVSAYNSILKESDKMDDKAKQQAYSKYISLISDIFSEKKSLVENKENNFVEQIELNTNKDKDNLDEDRNPSINNIIKDELDLLIKEKQKAKGFCYELNMLFGRIMILSVRNSQRLFLKCFATGLFFRRLRFDFFNYSCLRIGKAQI